MRLAVIPCSAGKLEYRSRAGNLYTGPLFRSALQAARHMQYRGELDGFRILSALHGLVSETEILEPYNVRMGDPRTVSSHAVALQLLELLDELEDGDELELLPLLPRDYDQKLLTAAAVVNGLERAHGHSSRTYVPRRVVTLANPLEGAPGIGYQRGRLRELREGTRSAL